MATYPIPGMNKWHRHAGGTAAAEGKYGYTFNAGTNGDYSISPYSGKYGRHLGYLLNVWNSPGKPWHHQIGTYRSPQAAVEAAREFAGKLAVANPNQVHHSIGYPTKAQAEKAKRALAKRGGGPYKVHHAGGWWYVLGPKVSNPPRRFPGTFQTLPVGATFRFSLETDYPYSGAARGPWVKTGQRTYTHAESGGKYRVGSVKAKVAQGNPAHAAGPSAIPTKWTPATVTRKGGQIQIRMGGRR